MDGFLWLRLRWLWLQPLWLRWLQQLRCDATGLCPSGPPLRSAADTELSGHPSEPRLQLHEFRPPADTDRRTGPGHDLSGGYPVRAANDLSNPIPHGEPRCSLVYLWNVPVCASIHRSAVRLQLRNRLHTIQHSHSDALVCPTDVRLTHAGPELSRSELPDSELRSTNVRLTDVFCSNHPITGLPQPDTGVLQHAVHPNPHCFTCPW